MKKSNWHFVCASAVLAASQAQAVSTTNFSRMGTVSDRLPISDCPPIVGPARTCSITVHVAPVAKKRCFIRLEPPVVVVNGPAGAKRDLEWKLQSISGMFRFEPVSGIELLGDDKDEDYEGGAKPDPLNDPKPQKFVAKYKAIPANKFAAFNYNVNIQRSLDGGTTWFDCGTLDPIIINRE